LDNVFEILAVFQEVRTDVFAQVHGLR